VRLEVCDVGERTGASEDVVRIARPNFAELDADKEHFLLLALNNKNRINGAKVISTGTLTACFNTPDQRCRPPKTKQLSFYKNQIRMERLVETIQHRQKHLTCLSGNGFSL